MNPMNRFKLTLFSITVLIFLQAGFAQSATYYIKNDGNDGASGLSDGQAWKTISKVNRFKFNNGDTVRFKRGDTFDDATLINPGVDSFTIEDYGSGEKPHFDGDKIMPISIDGGIHNLTIRNINISGQDWTTQNATNILLKNIDGVIIDGIEGNGHKGSNGKNLNDNGCYPIRLLRCSGYIEIKNCKLNNWGPNNMPVHNVGEVYAFEIDSTSTGTFKVHHNVVHDINADAIQVRMFQGVKGEIYNNKFYNCGENAVDLKSSDNIDVYNNDFYRETHFKGHGGIGGNHWHLINILASTEAGGSDSDNNTIRGNYLHDSDDSAIKLGYLTKDYYNDNNKIHSNWIENTRGIYFGNSAVNLKIYDNIILNSSEYAIREENGNKGTEIYNNTIYNDHQHNLQYAICLNVSNQTVIKNNVIFLDDPDAYGLYLKNGSFSEISCNYWYNALNNLRMNIRNTIYYSTDMDKWKELTAASEQFNDPKFKDPQNLDFSFVKPLSCNGKVIGVSNFATLKNIKNLNVRTLAAPSRLRPTQKP